MFHEDKIFAELRSACQAGDMDKAHHCIRWFLLHASAESAESALHYASRTVRQETRDSYRWPWWLEFVRSGRRASLEKNGGEFFRILAPDPEVLER